MNKLFRGFAGAILAFLFAGGLIIMAYSNMGPGRGSSNTSYVCIAVVLAMFAIGRVMR